MNNIIEIQDVFKDSGLPTYTFVEPNEFKKTRVALRTKGKGLIIEGPSGIGKTSCILKIIEGLEFSPLILSAIKRKDQNAILDFVKDPTDKGVVIIDDFHRLSKELKDKLTDVLKIGADESREDFKLILIGINRAGCSLIDLSPEITNRVDIVKFENNSSKKIEELISKGEDILNIQFLDKDAIIAKSCGSFHIAQMICKELCIKDNIEASLPLLKRIDISCESGVDSLMATLGRQYEESLKIFARGNKFRRGGQKAYLHILQYLSKSDEGCIRLTEIWHDQAKLKESLTQIASRGYIAALLSKHPCLQNNFYYDNVARSLTIEDPKLIFYLKNINFDRFAKKCGYDNDKSPKYKYTYALSFAGEKRDYAEAINSRLNDAEILVFYDFDHQAKIIGEDIEAYLKSIYASEAQFIIVLLDEYYPKKVWTRFEQSSYHDKFADHTIIPILFDNYAIDSTSKFTNVGNLHISTTSDMEQEIDSICKILIEKADMEI